MELKIFRDTLPQGGGGLYRKGRTSAGDRDPHFGRFAAGG